VEKEKKKQYLNT